MTVIMSREEGVQSDSLFPTPESPTPPHPTPPPPPPPPHPTPTPGQAVWEGSIMELPFKLASIMYYDISKAGT